MVNLNADQLPELIKILFLISSFAFPHSFSPSRIP